MYIFGGEDTKEVQITVVLDFKIIIDVLLTLGVLAVVGFETTFYFL